ncbi:MAG: hypothetical protein ABMB14_24820 [Myxococcota bacterium]
MQIRSESRIRYPRDQVYLAYRDRLPQIANYIPDIAAIVVHRREVTATGVTLHNEWIAAREIPAYAQPFVRPEHLRWDDYADWNDGKYAVDYTLVTRVFPEAVKCSGTNAFVDDGAGTKVVLTGELTIDVTEIAGIPKFLARSIGPRVERFVVSLITPNLESVNASIERFLDAEG